MISITITNKTTINNKQKVMSTKINTNFNVFLNFHMFTIVLQRKVLRDIRHQYNIIFVELQVLTAIYILKKSDKPITTRNIRKITGDKYYFTIKVCNHLIRKGVIWRSKRKSIIFEYDKQLLSNIVQYYSKHFNIYLSELSSSYSIPYR